MHFTFSFYKFSDDFDFCHILKPGSWSGLAEIFGKSLDKSVAYCQTPDDFFKKKPSKNVNAECFVVVDKLIDANGLTLTNTNDKLFVVAGKHVKGYNIDKNNPSKLTLYASIDTIYPCDNINPDPEKDNDLYVACFPYPMSLLYQIQSYPNLKMATMIRKINIDTKESSPYKIDPNGTLLAGATSAFHYKPFDVAVSVFDTSRYMVCSNLAQIPLPI